MAWLGRIWQDIAKTMRSVRPLAQCFATIGAYRLLLISCDSQICQIHQHHNHFLMPRKIIHCLLPVCSTVVCAIVKFKSTFGFTPHKMGKTAARKESVPPPSPSGPVQKYFVMQDCIFMIQDSAPSAQYSWDSVLLKAGPRFLCSFPHLMLDKSFSRSSDVLQAL